MNVIMLNNYHSFNNVFAMNSIPSWTISVVKASSLDLLFLTANPTDLRLWRLEIWYQTFEQKIAQVEFCLRWLCLQVKNVH